MQIKKNRKGLNLYFKLGLCCSVFDVRTTKIEHRKSNDYNCKNASSTVFTGNRQVLSKQT